MHASGTVRILAAALVGLWSPVWCYCAMPSGQAEAVPTAEAFSPTGGGDVCHSCHERPTDEAPFTPAHDHGTSSCDCDHHLLASQGAFRVLTPQTPTDDLPGVFAAAPSLTAFNDPAPSVRVLGPVDASPPIVASRSLLAQHCLLTT